MSVEGFPFAPDVEFLVRTGRGYYRYGRPVFEVMGDGFRHDRHAGEPLHKFQSWSSGSRQINKLLPRRRLALLHPIRLGPLSLLAGVLLKLGWTF